MFLSFQADIIITRSPLFGFPKEYSPLLLNCPLPEGSVNCTDTKRISLLYLFNVMYNKEYLSIYNLMTTGKYSLQDN